MKKTLFIISLALIASLSSCIEDEKRNCGKIIDKNVSFTQRGDVIYSLIVKTSWKHHKTFIVRKSVFDTNEVGNKEFCYGNPAPNADGTFRP